jgi:hypothetical protein
MHRRAGTKQERTVASMTFRQDLVVEKSQSNAGLASARAEEAAAREVRVVACAAADAAEAQLQCRADSNPAESSR